MRHVLALDQHGSFARASGGIVSTDLGRLFVERAFPALDCTPISAIKRIFCNSDAITALTLPCIATDATGNRRARRARAGSDDLKLATNP